MRVSHALAGGFVLATTLLVLPPSALALGPQQFQHQVGMLPGANWTEGVEAADVDRDGDYDLFFAEGDGFSAAGTKRQNVLQINRRVETGTLSFLDESVARLGTRVSNAKGVFTGDADGDGWVDAVFANGFRTDPPFLYMNRGAAQPGFFTEEGATRGLTALLSSASGQFGDVDDDGDLDIVLCDSGTSFLAGSGGKPRLYRNDGTGNFTEVGAPAWNPPTKRAQMDVHMVDIDGDFDLDFFGPNRDTNSGVAHYLMLNDGSGSFSDAGASLPVTSGQVYEAEVGDLDGDTDLDLFFVSVSGFAEGEVRNDTVLAGAPAFTKLANLNATADDNEVVLLDFDTDGDLDAFIASLDVREGLWRNDGGGTFANAQTAVQAISDSSLDATAVDLDLDGDYDLITAQGESNPGQFANKVYLNVSGAADTRAPLVLAVDAATPRVGGEYVVHAKVRDQVQDDGKNWLRAEAHFVYRAREAVTAIDVTGSAFVPAAVTVASGTRLVFSNVGAVPTSVRVAAPGYPLAPLALLPAGSWTTAFPRAGTYTIEGPGGAFTALITVVGPTTTASGSAQGEGQFRFAMPGAPAATLAFELEFTDAVGNVAIHPGGIVSAGGSQGAEYCFGDGGVAMGCTPCPCGNDAAPGSGGGCTNSSGSGTVLAASGAASVAANSLSFTLTGAPPSTFAVLTAGMLRLPSQATAPCLGFDSGTASAFLDGLRCTGGGVVRLGARAIDAAGQVGVTTNAWGNLLGASTFQVGASWHFQAVHRDNPALSCGRGQNTSQGISFTIAP